MVYRYISEYDMTLEELIINIKKDCINRELIINNLENMIAIRDKSSYWDFLELERKEQYAKDNLLAQMIMLPILFIFIITLLICYFLGII